MIRIVDLVADTGSNKDEKLLNYIRKNYLSKNLVTNLCFICGQGNNCEEHKQISATEFRDLVFNKNSKNTIYFLKSFFFDKDRKNYLKLMEDMCENDIQVFKTDQKKEHITNDKEWTDKYCTFLSIDDMEKN